MEKQDKHTLQLREINLRRLQILELQAAQFGINVPPHILLEIEDIKEKILAIDKQLKRSLEFNEGETFQAVKSSQININGNVSGSTIIIGNKNKVQNS